jgi:Family of unknown function (DUF6281)
VLGLVTAAALVSAAGCGGSGGASCADLITWHGHTYSGNTSSEPLSFGHELGSATRQGCNDGGGTSPDQTVTVVRIVGRNAANAIGVMGDTKTEYLAGR